MADNTYKIQMNGEWTLEDLYWLPHVYSQVYAFLYTLNIPLTDDREEQLYITFTAHPWRGGYSAVNFYSYLQNLVPRPDRPRVVSIQYGSPGLMELGLAVSIAISIRVLVKTFSMGIIDLHSLYNSIYKGLQDRKLMRIEVKRKELALEKEQLQFINEAVRKLSQMMGFKNVEQINKLTGNPLATLKILLSFYRRIRTLAGYEEEKKAKFE
jgi:hypothetical protein